MSVPKRKHKPSVRIEFEPETITRIEQGPLLLTGGKGKTSWIRNLVEKELDRLDGQTGGTK